MADNDQQEQAKSALIVGATGQTGRHLLRGLLASTAFARVAEYGRRVTAADKVKEYVASGKLVQQTIDFERIDDAGLRAGRWDVVFITLGTTKKDAGSAAAFERIDREYVINAARAAKSDDAAHKQRLVYVSAFGSDPNHWALYPRSKGLTEQGLAALGYADTIVVRPGFLGDAERESSRPLEDLGVAIMGFISHFTSSAHISVRTLADAVRLAGERGSTGLPPDVQPKTLTAPGSGSGPVPFTLIDNANALKLAAHANDAFNG